MKQGDLGHGHTLRFLQEGVGTGPLHAVGYIRDHPAADGADHGMPDGLCSSSGMFAGHAPDGQPVWSIVAGDPDRDGLRGLTLEPSLLCRSCGSHGYIRNGRWVPA